MKTKLLITVDAEENWEGPGSARQPDVSNIYDIPDLQKGCFDRFNIRPVYLLTYPVAIDQKAVLIFKSILDSGRCEVGAHLHNWNSPPFTEQDVLRKSFQYTLPYDVEKRKISDLTNIIQDNFGTRPVTFRAGRWGGDGETIKILSELDYKVDVSVLPLVDYTKDGGMDFTDAPFDPYFPSFDDIIKPDRESNNKVYEIPVTNAFSKPDFARIRATHKGLRNKRFKIIHLRGMLNRLNFVREIRLSPENSTFHQMKQLVDACLKRGSKVLHLNFHSSMNSPGKSPYSRDLKERDLRIRNLEKILYYITEVKGIKIKTASEIREDI